MSIKAVVVDPAAEGRLAFMDVAEPTPLPFEAVVKVVSISLNRGEVRRAGVAAAGWRPGWDLAGVVTKSAADGSGPKEGARVVGMLGAGSWAEQVAVPTHSLAELPERVTFAQASTLPVAGLTALHALRKGGLLLERSVLITGATGGVGDFALQLARLSGAKVVAQIRKREQESQVREAGADAVVVGDSIPDNAAFGPYHLILDSVGGTVLGSALSHVGEGGTLVSYGTSGGTQVTFDASKFYPIGRASYYGFILFDELKMVEPAGPGLAVLSKLVASGKLQTRISVEADWSEIADVARQLTERTYPGKAVLHVS